MLLSIYPIDLVTYFYMDSCWYIFQNQYNIVKLKNKKKNPASKFLKQFYL